MRAAVAMTLFLSVAHLEVPLSDTRPAVAPAAGHEVRLQALLQRARERAPSAAVARAETTHADAAVHDAKRLLPENPVAWVGLGARAFQDGGRAFEWQAQLWQPIEIAGQRRLRKRAAEQERRRRQAAVGRVAREVEHEVRAAYWRARVARERAALARSFESSTVRMLSIARSRLESGDASRLDVDLARADHAQAEAQRIAAEARYRAACRRLAAVSGWPGPGFPTPADPLPTPRPAGDTTALLDAALEDHPRIEALEAEARAADARLALARREAVPTTALGVQVQQEALADGGRETIGLATFSIGLPLWYRNRSSRAQARADRHVARTRRDTARAVLSQEIRRTSELVDAAYARLDVYREELAPNLRSSLEATERAFELGELALPEVTATRLRFLSSQERMLDAWEDYLVARAELTALLGGLR